MGDTSEQHEEFMEHSHYGKAKRALELYAKALRENTDEVKDCDREMAIRIYARMASDYSLEEDAIEVRMRAERGVGNLLEAMKTPEQRKLEEKRFRDFRAEEAEALLKELGLANEVNQEEMGK